MPQALDTTPVEVVEEVDPLKGVGTLAQQADRAAVKTKKRPTRLEAAKAAVSGIQGYGRLRSLIAAMGKPITDCLADVTSFDNLIDDREVFFNQMSASFHPDEGFRVQCFSPPPPDKTHPADEDGELSLMNMISTRSFLQSVTRYANSRTHIRGLTGTFLDSITATTSDQSREIAADLLNHLFKELEKRHTTTDKDNNKKVPKPVLLRTLRRDIRPAKERRWPKIRGCRAILHSGFRDDISHLWLIKQLADIVPTGNVVRYRFDGDLLIGAILVPEVARVEKDSEYGGGIFFFSGEVGNRRCGAMPFIYRSISQSMTLVGKPWGVTHSAKPNVEELEARLRSYIHRLMPTVTTSMDRLIDAQTITFSGEWLMVERLLISLRVRYSSLSKHELRMWAFCIAQEINLVPGLDLSVFTLQNGLTRMSQSVQDAVRQIELDIMAGNLLELEWDQIAARAATISDDQVREIFPPLN